MTSYLMARLSTGFRYIASSPDFQCTLSLDFWLQLNLMQVLKLFNIVQLTQQSNSYLNIKVIMQLRNDSNSSSNNNNN